MKKGNVKGTYLHGLLKESVFMDQPHSFDDGSGHVCKLVWSLYGLCQAGNVWNREFNEAMKHIGFIQLKADPCCYLWCQGEEFDIWLDNIISNSTSMTQNNIVEQDLSRKFEIKALGWLLQFFYFSPLIFLIYSLHAPTSCLLFLVYILNSFYRLSFLSCAALLFMRSLMRSTITHAQFCTICLLMCSLLRCSLITQCIRTG